MFRFLSLSFLLFDNSLLRIVDWHISYIFKILFTEYAISNVEEIVVFVSQ